MYRFALIAIPLLSCITLFGCSWSVRFYVWNNTAEPRQVLIEVEKVQSGFKIFNPQSYALVPLDGESPEYERTKTIGKPEIAQTIEIPARTALEIGHLNNEKYENSRQKLINGRVFNLVRLRSGSVEINRDNFDAYFRKVTAGYAWQLPAN